MVDVADRADAPTAGSLVAAVRELRAAAAAVPLALDIAGSGTARGVRDELVAQLDDYLIPRLEQQGAPLLVVVGGSTGAGKSTLVNSLVGQTVSAAGVLRPTTRAPVLAFSPSDGPWFSDERVLPGLVRVTGTGANSDQAATGRALQLAPTAALPPGLALLDTPDIDSVVSANRELARQLLAAADLWLFVTTAARYADAVPWELLRVARDRGTALALVLDRIPPEGFGEVDRHLRELLDAEGLAQAALLTVPETALDGGRLPDSAVAPVRRWVGALSADAGARAEVVRRTLDGALDSLQVRAGVLAGAVDEQERAAADLLGAVDAAYDHARAGVLREVGEGSLLRGEVLARWQELIGTGELMRTLESRIGRLRDRVAAAVTGRPTAARPVEDALERNLEALLRDAAEQAAADTAQAWRARPEGAALLDAGGPDLARADRATLSAVPAEIRAWQGDVLDLVRAEGGDRRKVAKLASYGVNGAGSVLIVALFAQTGGLTGGEIAIAGGTAAVSQKVLEAVFGDQAVRLLATRAQEALEGRVEDLLRRDAGRFRDLVTHRAPAAGSAGRLRDAARTVRTARERAPGRGRR